ncbi:WD40 repeat-like protein [Metschnikowia bicuspidata var. bicuspidata NRRL YB-4993]|uniref:WD40 repeat-like protein n=1 Tax=Metschnikowia bicuspidata var. bicuspidata NRRL YB-4993 TaxID=869754 RepID=A0A1A0H7K2_9ASCO|nr:WD40 repeat-like protein [Metschnikowia bicuspidata var. bicuspidata NRRL YB-4993]OBA19872.1 WD40 repeat-like protein [Metschnikowia bicuspidata var. bicuspidata NRRL YB-4993]
MHIITIQETFLEVLLDVSSGKTLLESIWLARRDSENEEQQEFFDISVLLKDDLLVLTIGDGPEKDTYALEFPESKLHLGLRGSKISASAISPNGAILIAGTDTGHVFQYDVGSKLLAGEIKNAHLADVLRITVLPSSQVMMTVGLDLQTKLWPVTAEPEPLPVRVFSRQKAQITDIAVVDRGRNFLTASLDGSVVLWECSSAQVVSQFRRIDNLSDPVTCMALAGGETVEPGNTVGGDFLFGCQDKYMYVGYGLGTIQQYSVAGHFQTGPKLQRTSAVTSLCVEGQYLVAGYADGLLRVHDVTRSNDETHSAHWDCQMNPNFPIKQANVQRAKSGRGLVIVAANGPELLLKIEFDGARFEYSQLVGLSEMFRVVLVGSSGDAIFITTENEVVQY